MNAEQAFEAIEDQLLDCPRNKVRFSFLDGTPLEAYEIYESEYELNIVLIKPKEDNE